MARRLIITKLLLFRVTPFFGVEEWREGGRKGREREIKERKDDNHLHRSRGVEEPLAAPCPTPYTQHHPHACPMLSVPPPSRPPPPTPSASGVGKGGGLDGSIEGITYSFPP